MEYEGIENDILFISEPESEYFNLKVVKRTHTFIQKIYNVSKQFPSEEKFGMTSQMRRAATSINLNIIEGKYRSTQKEFIRFLEVARGSCAETHYLLRLAKDMDYINSEVHAKLSDENTQIWKMLNALITHFKKS
jgi:four helix bundle protein